MHMISVVVSTDLGSGQAFIEKICNWHDFAEPEDRHDVLDQTIVDLAERYQGRREFYCESAENLLSFFQKHPELSSKPAAKDGPK